MHFSRRTFLKLTAAGAYTLGRPASLFADSRTATPAFYGVHSFVTNHPDAVFVIRTNVGAKTDASAIKQAAIDFTSSIFTPLEQSNGGMPIANKVVIKPNITCRQTEHPLYTRLGTMGIVTDSNFVEGVIEGLNTLGVARDRFYIRETNCPGEFEEGGYFSMAARTGADLRDLHAPVTDLDPADVNWVDVPNGVWFKKLPFLAPVASPDTLLLNIAKLKTHLMGLTLTAKNMQGSIAHNYQEHCTLLSGTMNIDAAHIQPGAVQAIQANYQRHRDAIPRWDRPGDTGGIWQETWAARCLDTNSVVHPALHIIEGIYGRDGNFVEGPSSDGTAADYMMNYIIFGKNQFHVDTIGVWLAGHEPGNFGLFHMAIERGQSTLLNPEKIPLYEWNNDGSAALIPLTDLARTPLKTPYLRRDYNGQSEGAYHMVDEHYDYPTEVREHHVRPPEFVLHQNYPNPFNPSTSIEFSIPVPGHVRLEICDVTGSVVDVVADRFFAAGSHLLVWNAKANANGVYFCRMFCRDATQIRPMVLLK